MKRKYQKIPDPVDVDCRFAFTIKWFDNERYAERFGRVVQREGRTYKGGLFDGHPCGRDEIFDKDHTDGRRLYAVTC